MIVRVLPPRDFYHEHTVSLKEWINGGSDRDNLLDYNMKKEPFSEEEYYFHKNDTLNYLGFVERILLAAEAINAFKNAPYFEQDGLNDIRVFYDVINDKEAFLAKISNNGTTFIYCDESLPLEDVL